MKKIVYLFFSIVVLGAVGYGVWVYEANSGAGGDKSSSADQVADGAASAAPDGTTSAGDSPAAVNSVASETFSETYDGSKYGFTLKYPPDLEPTLIPAGDGSVPESGDMILFQKSGTNLGFQIVISDFYEDNANITPDRILEDIPDQVIKNPEPVNLGSFGRGTTFLDGDPKDSNTSRQIWFAANNHLYQITSQPSFDPLMQKILATWEVK